jgi:hypothetical protein
LSAAAILLQVRSDGLELVLTPAGTLKGRGPREALGRWTPVIAENKDSIIEALAAESASPPTQPASVVAMPSPSPPTPEQLADARASVDRLLADMAAELERRRGWYAQPVEGWREGVLTIRSVIDGELTTIRLSKRGRPH